MNFFGVVEVDEKREDGEMRKEEREKREERYLYSLLGRTSHVTSLLPSSALALLATSFGISII